MILQEALYAQLTTAPAETAAAIATRLYPNIVPAEAELPVIAYQVIGTPARSLAHDGPVEFARVLVQFTIMARNYLSAKTIAGGLRRDLDGFRGIMGGVSGVTVYRAHVENEIDDNELTDADIVRLDVSINYREI